MASPMFGPDGEDKVPPQAFHVYFSDIMAKGSKLGDLAPKFGAVGDTPGGQFPIQMPQSRGPEPCGVGPCGGDCDDAGAPGSTGQYVPPRQERSGRRPGLWSGQLGRRHPRKQ